MSATTDALKRAKQRLGAHGWRQGPLNPKSFNGYSFRDAIVGKAGGEGTETEQRAVAAAAEAARFLDHDTKDWPAEGFLEAWNDKPGRTREQVLTVINIATGYAEAADLQAEAPRSEAVQPTSDARPTPVQPDHDASDASPGTPMGLMSSPISNESVTTQAPELAAQAIALGYEVDATWTEYRLKGAIAAAKATDAKLEAMAPPPVEPIKPMPTPLALMSGSERRDFFLNRKNQGSSQ